MRAKEEGGGLRRNTHDECTLAIRSRRIIMSFQIIYCEEDNEEIMFSINF